MHTATLTLLDGRRLATNHYGSAGLTMQNVWNWVVGHLAAEFSCEPDEISIIESNDDEARDLIALRGSPIAFIETRSLTEI
jgi:hypothetical protein